MAELSLDNIVSGSCGGSFFYKFYSGKASDNFHDLFLATGIPSHCPSLTTIGNAGEAVNASATSSYIVNDDGQYVKLRQYSIEYPETGANQKLYLKSYVTCNPYAGGGSDGGEILYDRLWHNYMSLTSNATITINSADFPPRDDNGSSNGEGVHIALVGLNPLSNLLAAATITYTNSRGVTGRIGRFSGFTNIGYISAGANRSVVCIAVLDEGDSGVRSIQTFSVGGALSSAHQCSLVAFRAIDSAVASLTQSSLNFSNQNGILARPPVRIYHDSVLSVFALAKSGGNTSREHLFGQLAYVII